MEWYESLFQQVCTYLLMRSRTAQCRREDLKLIADQAGFHELIQAYGRSEIKAVFSVSDVMPTLNSGKEIVLLVNVRESVFHKTAQELLRGRWGFDVRQILAASLETGSSHLPASGHQFDVVVCRKWDTE